MIKLVHTGSARLIAIDNINTVCEIGPYEMYYSNLFAVIAYVYSFLYVTICTVPLSIKNGVYIDKLLLDFKHSGYGCHLGDSIFTMYRICALKQFIKTFNSNFILF